MDKKSAITIINKQIDKLKLLEDPKYHSLDWRVQTITYIDTFFGPDSPQVNRIKDSPIGSQYSPDLTQFLNDCIETITDIGLYKKPKPNFLFTAPNWLVTFLFTAIFTIGGIIGKCTSDTQNVELKRENKILSDSIHSSSIADRVTDPIKN